MSDERVVELKLQKSECDLIVRVLRTIRDQANTALRGGVKLPAATIKSLTETAGSTQELALKVEEAAK